jgi:clan AA aspartic protease
MITGVFSSNGEPHIRLFVRGVGGIVHEVDVVVDTGFNGELTLPAALIAALGLAFHRQEQTILADGSTIETDTYQGIVIWDGAERSILVEASEGDALVGTLLMDGYELRVEMRTGGAVTLTPLP